MLLVLGISMVGMKRLAAYEQEVAETADRSTFEGFQDQLDKVEAFIRERQWLLGIIRYQKNDDCVTVRFFPGITHIFSPKSDIV